MKELGTECAEGRNADLLMAFATLSAGAAGSVVLDAHLLQGDDRLGTVLDAELAEGWS
ncbi:hypothetical protein [Aeromonas encheleia]